MDNDGLRCDSFGGEDEGGRVAEGAACGCNSGRWDDR